VQEQEIQMVKICDYVLPICQQLHSSYHGIKFQKMYILVKENNVLN